MKKFNTEEELNNFRYSHDVDFNIPFDEPHCMSAMEIPNMIKRFDKKIEELENELEKLKESKRETILGSKEVLKKYLDKETEDIYAVQYFFDSDIHNNGGVNTILNETNLMKLLNNNFKKVYLVKLYNLKSTIDSKIDPLPVWLSDFHLDNIKNPQNYYWIKRIKNI